MNQTYLRKFLTESNMIEGILTFDMHVQVAAANMFLSRTKITEHDLEDFVGVIQPDAQLRGEPSIPGVQVGSHIAPISGPEVLIALDKILHDSNRGGDPWRIHCAYERLHPFTDGNGRSGRLLWLWQNQSHIGERSLSFLHQFYYATLSHSRSM